MGQGREWPKRRNLEMFLVYKGMTACLLSMNETILYQSEHVNVTLSFMVHTGLQSEPGKITWLLTNQIQALERAVVEQSWVWSV